MNRAPASRSDTSGQAWGRAAHFRWGWTALVTILLVLYLGWGYPRIWGIVALVPAGALLIARRRASGEHPLGAWHVVILVAGLICGAGSVLLPLQPSPAWLAQQAEADDARLRKALRQTRERMGEALDRIAARLEDERSGRPLADRIRAVWPSVRSVLGEEAGAISLVRPDEQVVAWAGSPFLVPEKRLVDADRQAMRVSQQDRYLVTGDSLAVLAYRFRTHREGTLVASLLLARHPDTIGPAPGAVPVLDRELPARISRRLRIIQSGSGDSRRLEISAGAGTAGASEQPLRGVLQGVLLLLVLSSTLGLLGRDTSVARGLLAAPLIYSSVVPVALGRLGAPFSIAMITPSWSGHQLTNQAFLAVGAAALAIWFAFAQLGAWGETHRRGRFRPAGVAALVGTSLIWGIGLALLQDLYRFAPTWFWARVSFLPAGRDLVGWLIAIAMTLVIVAGTGGAVAVLVRRVGLWGLLLAGAAAVAGTLGAFLLGAWSGTLWVGMAAALIGSVLGGWLLLSLRERPALALLLGLGLVATLVHLPLKWDLGRLLARRTVEEAAGSLREAGVGLSPDEVAGLRDRLLVVAGEVLPWLPAGSGPDSEVDRSAYLLWRRLRLAGASGASGIYLSGAGGSTTGRFATAPDLFSVSLLDSLVAQAGRGEPRLVLTGGAPGFFGEEMLLMAVGGGDEGMALVAGIRRRPLSFVASGEERIWMRNDPAGTAERAGRLVGVLYLRIYDEAYRLLAVPHAARSAPEGAEVPVEVVGAIRERSGGGVWHRRGSWIRGGADEYYFLLEAPGERPTIPGAAITLAETAERRIALLGIVQPGIWGRVVETLNLLLLCTGALLALAWLPAVALSSSGIPLARRLRRVSFRTRLLIPLLVVALVPMVALWLFTRAFILNREASAWEESLDRSVREVRRSILRSSERLAADLAREAYRGSMASVPEMPEGTRWAVYDPELVQIAGNLTATLADRIPVRETVLGRGPRTFVLRSDDAWSAAIAPIGADYGGGAALVVQPLTPQLLREVAAASPWQVDLFVDGRLRHSTDPGPYNAGLLPRLLPHEAEWEGSRGRAIGAYRWGDARGLRYVAAYRPLTDYAGFTVATVAQRRFGMWGLRDPALDRLFANVASIYLLLVGAVTLVALMVARRISRPIGSLTRSVRRVSGGDLDVEIPVTRGDEVGGLQKAFRQMLIALRESRSRLAQAERERAWQEMARQVAHEIKNPLTPMQLSAQFLRRAFDEDAEDLDRIVRECTESIVEQVEELRRIANEFSAYARLPVVSRSPTVLNEPVEEALNLFLPALPDGITVERQIAEGLPEVELDSEQIRRVVINLIRNALDAMGERGTLRVRTGCDEEGVWLQIGDTGEGIAPEVQERLFEPYFSTKTDGTGLGLAITRAVVDAHGGTLTVESRPGEGTTMTAHFPLT